MALPQAAQRRLTKLEVGRKTSFGFEFGDDSFIRQEVYRAARKFGIKVKTHVNNAKGRLEVTRTA